jgi:hypothetical protein
MTCQRAREVFPELLDRRTTATAHLDARAHLASCPDCQREFAALSQTAAALDAMPTPPPSPRLRKNFYTMLEEEKHSAASVRAVTERQHRARHASFLRWVLVPFAACALIALGFAVGRRSAPAASAATTDDATKQHLVALQSQMAQQREQIENMTKLVSISILQQQQNPANERLTNVLAAAKSANPDTKVLQDLLLAATLDPSANVRLRAIEALYPHADREVVRAGVLAALPREQNPLVQLELIDFVAGAQERNAGPALEKIADDESANASVRDAAKFALAQL